MPPRPTLRLSRPAAARPSVRAQSRAPRTPAPAPVPLFAEGALLAPPSGLAEDSLAWALWCAAEVLALVRNGCALPQALQRVAEHLPCSPGPRGAVQDLAYRSLRVAGHTEALIPHLTERAPTPAQLKALLQVALALLLPEGDAAPYEAFVVVDQAVHATQASAVHFGKNMVNAVLRRFLRERATLTRLANKTPEGRWNYPQWWIDQCQSAYPQRWQAVLVAADSPPPLTLRVNQRRSTRDAYLERLAADGIEAWPVGPCAVRLARPRPVQAIPGFAEGVVSVQDAAAQLAAPLLQLSEGMRVLDACAAPGGKTGHLLECATLDLLALDVDATRLKRVQDNLQRLSLSATLMQGDASRRDWWDGRPFARILADVPCTASGVVRRHPDSRWLRRKEDAPALAALSAGILDNLWSMLAPGGLLLMVTCSIWPVESEEQAARFATRHGARRLPAPGQLFPEAGTSDRHNEHDGLFYALFQKAEENSESAGASRYDERPV